MIPDRFNFTVGGRAAAMPVARVVNDEGDESLKETATTAFGSMAVAMRFVGETGFETDPLVASFRFGRQFGLSRLVREVCDSDRRHSDVEHGRVADFPSVAAGVTPYAVARTRSAGDTASNRL